MVNAALRGGKVQCRRLLIEIRRQEVETAPASHGFLPTLQRIKLRKHSFRKGTPAKTVTTACAHQVVPARGRHRSCQPWFPSDTSTSNAAPVPGS